jgi:cell division protein FtsI (penicillin-binding protein 3)
MMRDVVLEGTGKRAQLEGYTVSGKTGTAWKYDPKKGYSEGKRISSFIGMAPADNPAVVIAIMLDEPTIGVRDGGTVAAPIFKVIAEQVLPQLNVKPDKNIHVDSALLADNAKEEQEGTESPTNGKTVAADDKKEKGDKADEKSKDKKADDKNVALDKKKPDAKPKTEKDKKEKSKT